MFFHETGPQVRGQLEQVTVYLAKTVGQQLEFHAGPSADDPLDGRLVLLRVHHVQGREGQHAREVAQGILDERVVARLDEEADERRVGRVGPKVALPFHFRKRVH